MEEVNEDERKALVVFCKTVEDVLPNEYTKSDDFLIRWLRARDLNQQRATELLRSHLRWPAEHSVDHILELPPDPYMVENFPGHFGVALDGGPVFCVSLKNWDVRKLVSDNKIPQFTHHCNWIYESLADKIQRYNESRGPGDKAVGFTAILNWEGFSITQMTSFKGIQALLGGFSTFESHYPETLAKAFFVNTGYVFQTLFVMIKPLFAPKTLTKFGFYGTNRAEWEPAVRARVEGSQIPYEFGGVMDPSEVVKI